MEKNQELQELYHCRSRKTELESELVSLNSRQKELSPQVKQLARQVRIKRWVLSRLNQASVISFLYRAAGKLEQKRESVQIALRAIEEQYAKSDEELTAISTQLHNCKESLSAIKTDDARYQELYDQKLNWLHTAEGTDAQKFAGKERTLSFLEGQLTFLQEAGAAGRSAQNVAGAILSSLDSLSLQVGNTARKGLLSSMNVQEHLAEAQSSLSQLQERVNDFEKKLAMTSVRGKTYFSAESIEIWKPGFFTAHSTTWDRIKTAEKQLIALQQRIGQLLEQVRRETEQIKQKQQKNRVALEEMVISMDWSE